MSDKAPPSIYCPRCGKRSWNPTDVRERYCGYCRAFHDDVRVKLPHQQDRD